MIRQEEKKVGKTLILSKLNWAKNTKSEMQMRDVAGILRNEYDEKYVRYWAKKLGIENLLKDCLAMLEENYVERIRLVKSRKCKTNYG